MELQYYRGKYSHGYLLYLDTSETDLKLTDTDYPTMWKYYIMPEIDDTYRLNVYIPYVGVT